MHLVSQTFLVEAAISFKLKVKTVFFFPKLCCQLFRLTLTSFVPHIAKLPEEGVGWVEVSPQIFAPKGHAY